MQRSGSTAATVEFSYVSNVSRDLPASVLMRLARQCWSHNLRAGLTGVLRFDGGRFEQVVEGPSHLILPLAARILADARHEAIRIQGFRAIEARRYADWTSSGFDADDDEAPPGNLLRLAFAAALRPAPAAVASGATFVVS